MSKTDSNANNIDPLIKFVLPNNTVYTTRGKSFESSRQKRFAQRLRNNTPLYKKVDNNE